MVNSMMLLRKMSQLYSKPTTCRMELTMRIQTSSIRRKQSRKRLVTASFMRISLFLDDRKVLLDK